MSDETDGKWNSLGFSINAVLFQITLLGLFAGVTDYGSGLAADTKSVDEMDRRYPLHQDVAVMIFIGFGCLMSVFHHCSFQAIGMNFFLSAAMVQWGILLMHFWLGVAEDGSFHTINLDMKIMIDGLFVAGSCMVSYGAVLGKMAPAPLLWFMIIQVIGQSINFHMIATRLGVVDMGGSCLVHLFGAVTGIAGSWAFGIINEHASPENVKKAVEEKKVNTGPTKGSDMYAMIGTLFLFMFWPSFNGGLADGAQQQRVAINTVLALNACAVVGFAASCLMRNGKFNMIDIQNATLAGGVAIGSSADLLVAPWGAILTGSVAAVVSVWGFAYAQKFLEEKLNIHDTCGVFWLHGLPGIMGGIGGAVSAGAAESKNYGQSIGLIYPKMGTSNATEAKALGIEPGEDRSATHQAGLQFAAVLITLGLGVVTGLIMGFVSGSRLFWQVPTDKMFDDAIFWDEEGEEEEHGENKNTSDSELQAVETKEQPSEPTAAPISE